jgi:hypothetical protein
MKVQPVKSIAPDGRTLSLTVGREYEVLGIEAGWYRLLDDPGKTPHGDPVLFEPECFDVTDPTIPSFWDCSIGPDHEQYCYPEEWNGAGFFEDYHGRIDAVRKRFWEDLRRYYPETWQARKGVR